MITFNAFANTGAVNGQSATDRQGIADDLDTFLTLLTTQLQNQNPLDPLDTNQFTQQLVQFAGVEQQIKGNEQLEALAQLSASQGALAVTSYIGKDITASGNDGTLSNGQAEWNYSLDKSSQNVTFTVTDSFGREVWTQTGAGAAGYNRFAWNGQMTAGGIAADGQYRLSVRAVDSSGGVVDARTALTGRVTGVDFTGSEAELLIGDRRVKLSDVSRVAELPAAPATQ